MTDIQDYPYLYETHLHTSRGSKCAVNTGIEIADAHYKAGYTGIIITEHNWGGNTAVDRGLSWEDFVEEFCRGYEEAYLRGKEIGLQVFYGWEAGYAGTEFLIYGPDKQWMIKHPEIKDATIEEQFVLVNACGGMVVHAHPYREESYIPTIRLFPEYVNAVETVNACHSNSRSTNHFCEEYNTLAVQYASDFDLPQTAGSDTHSSINLLGGGMRFKRPLKDIHDYITAVKEREPYLLTDGEHLFMQNLS